MTNRRLASRVCLAVGSLLFATSAATADEAADHAALRQLVHDYEVAIQKGDPSLLQPYLAPGFTGVMVTGEEVNDYAALDAYWKKIQGLLGERGKYSVKVDIPEQATIAGDVAFAHGTTEDTAITSDGKEYKFTGFWTAICARQDDGWKIVRIHGSMDAITNTFVVAALRAASTSAAIFGGVAGFVVGAILFWILGRRQCRAATTA
jgi:ketosteroid isomerase-like protein